MIRRLLWTIGLLGLASVVAACGGRSQSKVVFMLDWVPNTNHTGVFVALDKGWYREEGIDLQVIEPGQTGVEQIVGAGQADFGISYSEWLTTARSQGVPIVSVAAVIQHNTSGFASPADRGLTRPKDLEGRKYGGSGLDIEHAMLQALMQCDGGDVNEVEFVNTGYADYFAITQRDVDFAWIYYAWTGIDAEVRGEATNVIWLRDYFQCVPDYYTPIVITNEAMLKDNPDLVRRFLAATARGYEYAISNPDDAAAILIEHAEADPELIRRSQAWLSQHYNEDAPQWGYQDPAVWQRFVQWMSDNKLVAQPVDAARAFTNDYLPERN